MRNSGFRGPSRQRGWLQFLAPVVGALISKKASDKAGSRADTADARSIALEEERLDLARQQEGRASELYQHYKDTYLPVEKALVADASRGISPARAEAAATADVRMALDTARGREKRELGRRGVDPSSGRYVGLETMRNLEEAKIEVGARTDARRRTRGENFARKADVAALGRGIPATSTYAAGLAGSGIAGASSLASARARDAEALSYDASRGFGRSIGQLVDTGLEAWRTRRTTEDPYSSNYRYSLSPSEL